MYGKNGKPRRPNYRNGESHAIHKVQSRAVGTLGPNDRGEIRQLALLRVFPDLAEAIRHIETLRQQQTWPDDITFHVTTRYHDARGKVVDQEQDVFIG